MKKRLTLIVMGVCGVALALACVACAPQAQETKPGGGGDSGNESSTPVVTVEWSPESDCASCHTVEGESMTDSACLAKVHADNGNTCITCHTDTDGLETAHKDATMDGASKVKRLKETEITKDLCLSSGCHVQADITAATAAVTVLTDSSGKTVNPHDTPKGEGHAKETCASCHVEHTAEAVTETAPTYCTSCHHADVYECGTCHE